MSLEDYLRRSMFAPLDMRDTGFHVPKNQRHRLGPVHGRDASNKMVLLSRVEKSPYLRPAVFQSGGRGLISTARDYFRFCQMMLNQGVLDGNRLLRPSTIRLLYTNQLPDSIPDVRFGETKVADGFGLGFAIQTANLGTPKQERIATVYRWGAMPVQIFTSFQAKDCALFF